MDYFGIIKKAYEINKKNRFLWIFGILIGGMGGGVSSFNYQTPSPDTTRWEQTVNSAQFTQKIADFWANFGNMVIIGGVILLLVCLLFFILNIISRGALVGSVNRIDKGEKADFQTGFRIGWHNFWRIWGVMIIYLLFVLASLCLLVIPTCLLVIGQFYALAVAWGILMFFVCLAFWLLISLISPYSLIVVILENLNVWDSIRESLHLVRRNLLEIIFVYLIMLAITIAYGVAIFLAFLLIGALGFAIGMALWLASVWTAVIYGCVLGLFLIAALIVINGAFKSFYSTVLVLTYNRLKK